MAATPRIMTAAADADKAKPNTIPFCGTPEFQRGPGRRSGRRGAERILTLPPQNVAGVLWREFDQAAEAHQLATTGGQVSHTGIAGLTLGRGLGYLMGKHGAACDNLLSVELVAALGETLT